MIGSTVIIIEGGDIIAELLRYLTILLVTTVKGHTWEKVTDTANANVNASCGVERFIRRYLKIFVFIVFAASICSYFWLVISYVASPGIVKLLNLNPLNVGYNLEFPPQTSPLIGLRVSPVRDSEFPTGPSRKHVNLGRRSKFDD